MNSYLYCIDFLQCVVSLVELDSVIGRLSLPDLATSEFVIPDDSQVSLTGPRGVWGRSLLLVNGADGRRACATISVSSSVVS